MKKFLLTVILAAAALPAQAGNLWEWAPGHYTYTDDCGNQSQGWNWAPGHTTWTDPNGGRQEVWEWAPGHWSVNPR
jgi:hypothetical protein